MAGDRSEVEAVALFDPVYDEHHRAVYAYLLARTRDPDVAVDVLQEVFLRVWRSVGRLSDVPPDRRRFWLFAIARNAATDHDRSVAARAAAYRHFEAQVRGPGPSAPGPEAQALRTETLQLVDQAIGRLPEELRTILVLQAVGELSSAEIGQALGRPAGTIRYLLAQARRRLAEELRLIEHDDGAKERSDGR